MSKSKTQDRTFADAMLVDVDVSLWEARKFDKKVTREVNTEHGATPDAGRWHKHLFGGKTKTLGQVITAATQLRREHEAQTLPWDDSGWRLLPTANFMSYAATMRKARERFEAAVDAFIEAYPGLVREARQKLNGMFNEREYPTAPQVRAKYRIRTKHTPLPSGSDFRVALPKAELDRVAKEVEERVAGAVQVALKEAWQRLGDAITELRPKLDDGKYLRPEMIERLKELAELLGRLNVTQDPALEDARRKVITDLATFDATALRDDAKVRADAAAKADAILKSMKGVYTPIKKEEK